jgi:hypothetical protein
MKTHLIALKRRLLKCVVAAVGSLVALGCQQDPNNAEENPVKLVIKQIGYSIYRISPNYTNPPYFCDQFLINGESYIGVSVPQYDFSIHLISLKDTSRRFSYTPNKEKMGVIRTFDVEDSLIYTFSRAPGLADSNQIHVLKIDDSIQYSHHVSYSGSLNLESNPTNPEGPFQEITCFGDAPIRKVGNKLFISIHTSGIFSDRTVTSGYLDMITGFFFSSGVQYPKEYDRNPISKRDYYLAQSYIDPPFCYYTFPASAHIFKYSITEKRVAKVFYAKSRYLPNLNSPPNNPTTPKDQVIALEKLRRDNGEYGKLISIRSKGNKYYVRLVFTPATEEIPANVRGTSMILMDSTLKTIYESEVEYGISEGGFFAINDTIFAASVAELDSAQKANGYIALKKYIITSND